MFVTTLQNNLRVSGMFQWNLAAMLSAYVISTCIHETFLDAASREDCVKAAINYVVVRANAQYGICLLYTSRCV